MAPNLLRRPTTPCLARPARLHIAAPAATAAAELSAATEQGLPQVDPPPTVSYTQDSVNSVVVTGTVLTQPQLRHLPASQVAASVRLGLRPRLHRPGLPPPPLGAATVNAYGALALQLAQHVHKGSRLQVHGCLREDTWADKVTGEPRWMVKIVAESLALLAPHEGTAEQAAPEEHAVAAEQYAAAHEQAARQAAPAAAGKAAAGKAAPKGPSKPQFTASAQTTLAMYEREGLSLEAIAARRGLKLSSVITHLAAAGEAGALSSWQRLAGDVQLGPPGGAALSPADVADAIFAVQQRQQQGGDAPLAALPIKAIRGALEGSVPAKVAALLAAPEGEPRLYGAIRLVTAMLDHGVSFTLVHEPPPPLGAGPPF
ncbi:single-stranded DNA-binding [Micractinium conductrix]|uniref:Single-stranded DNA-binding n=1 Tax=Micractinium conductrix TaxID=554055 RepID=A0A2P6VFN3_9CHLO|nr:single-stranded DNA-binding [Micractinium conductrix]|eukprot:PSC72900.1 single-stranded DNA-binding [Micractinium conductrix]